MPSLIDERDDLPAPRPVQTQRLWLPADVPSNNILLQAQRAEGFSAGIRYYERTHNRRKSPAFRPYSKAIASLRAHAAAQARANLIPCPAEHWVRLAFFLLGHHRFDPDAWYLAGKAITDGLQDAGIIGRDGADVHSTEGRCVRSVEEAVTLLYPAGGWRGDPPVGMLVQVSPWG